MDRHVVVAGELHTSKREHLAPRTSHLEHLVKTQPCEFSCLRNHARISTEHSGDIRVDLTHVRTQRSRHCDGRGITATASECRHFTLGTHALKTGNHRHLALRQCLTHAVTLDLEDLRLGVRRVGDDAHLAAREAHRFTPQIIQRHAQQCHRNSFAGSEQHVHLATLRVVRHLTSQLHQVVSGLAHRRHHYDHVVTLLAGLCDVSCDILHAIRIGHGRATELLHKERHRCFTLVVRG